VSDFETKLNGGDTFLGIPAADDPASSGVDVGIIGIPMVTSYSEPGSDQTGPEHMVPGSNSNPGSAPRAIRQISQNLLKYHGCYDFDLGQTMRLDRDASIRDFGDVIGADVNDQAFARRATAAIRTLLSHHIIPLIIGGDHATTIPAIRAFETRAPICVVQIDAHMDFRDEIAGMREGYGSPLRRAAELSWVTEIVHVGLRGWGAAREADVQDSLRMGNTIITAEQVHDGGVQRVIQALPTDANFYITLDIDGLDPSIAPGVLFPSHGGLTYYQTAKLLGGISQKGIIVGLDLVEYSPGLDVNNRTSLLAVRLILDMIGFMSQNGQISTHSD
jgi:agmatinase